MAENVFPKVGGDAGYASEWNTQFGNFVTLEAAENITAGNVCYIHLTDGKAYVSDTGTANDIRANGIAMATVTSGSDVTLQISGVYYTTGLTDKEDYYLGATGAVSTTVSAVRVGTANGTTQLIINIVQDDRDQVGTVKAWAKTLTGVPALTAFWVECGNAGALSDAESPINGQTIPDLNNAQKLIRGNTTSGTTGGGLTHTHQMGSGYAIAYGAGGPGYGGINGSPGYVTIGTGTNASPYMDMVWIIKIK